MDGRIVAAVEHLPEEARFAQAWHLARGGDLQRSLAIYQEIATTQASPLAGAARYNMGNLFFGEALRARKQEDEHAALPYLELAKQANRDTLRAEPGRYEARYNLERALRLLPEGGGSGEDEVRQLSMPSSSAGNADEQTRAAAARRLEHGAEHLSSLKEPHLRELASKAGIAYARLTTPESLLAALRRPELARSRPVATDLRWGLAAIALLALALAFAPIPPARTLFHRG